jgi:hypothetical protein
MYDDVAPLNVTSLKSSVADPDPVRSGPLWSDPDPGLHKCPYINYFGLCKSHEYFMNICCLTFWFKNTPFRAYFGQKNFQKMSKNFLRQENN